MKTPNENEVREIVTVDADTPVIDACNELVEVLDRMPLEVAYMATSFVLLDLISELLQCGRETDQQKVVMQGINEFHSEFVELLAGHGFNFGSQSIN